MSPAHNAFSVWLLTGLQKVQIELFRLPLWAFSGFHLSNLSFKAPHEEDLASSQPSFLKFFRFPPCAVGHRMSMTLLCLNGFNNVPTSWNVHFYFRYLVNFFTFKILFQEEALPSAQDYGLRAATSPLPCLLSHSIYSTGTVIRFSYLTVTLEGRNRDFYPCVPRTQHSFWRTLGAQ